MVGPTASGGSMEGLAPGTPAMVIDLPGLPKRLTVKPGYEPAASQMVWPAAIRSSAAWIVARGLSWVPSAASSPSAATHRSPGSAGGSDTVGGGSLGEGDWAVWSAATDASSRASARAEATG